MYVRLRLVPIPHIFGEPETSKSTLHKFSKKKKSNNHLEILGARTFTLRKFHTVDLQLLDATLSLLVNISA